MSIVEIREDLKCACCFDLLATAVSFDCGHVSCSCCAYQWLSKADSCPVCRNKSKLTSLRRIFALDSLTEKEAKNVFSNNNELYEEWKQRRDKGIELDNEKKPIKIPTSSYVNPERDGFSIEDFIQDNNFDNLDYLSDFFSSRLTVCEWICPLCSKSSNTIKSCCECNIKYDVIGVANDYRLLFKDIKELFFKIFESHNLPHLLISSSSSSSNLLEKCIINLLNSSKLIELKGCGYDIEFGVNNLLFSVLNKQKKIYFESIPSIDINSLALIAILFNQIRQEIELKQLNIVVEEPFNNKIIKEDIIIITIENLLKQKYIPNENTINLIQTHNKFIYLISKLIVYPGSDEEWNSTIKAKYNVIRNIINSIEKMRFFIRDLYTLVEDVEDHQSKALVESIYSIVCEIELSHKNNLIDKKIIMKENNFNNDLTLMKHNEYDELKSLKTRLHDCTEQYINIITILIKIIRNIINDPSNLKYRILKQKSSIINKYIFSNPEILILLINIGFVIVDDNHKTSNLNINNGDLYLEIMDNRIQLSHFLSSLEFELRI